MSAGNTEPGNCTVLASSRSTALKVPPNCQRTTPTRERRARRADSSFFMIRIARRCLSIDSGLQFCRRFRQHTGELRDNLRPESPLEPRRKVAGIIGYADEEPSEHVVLHVVGCFG